MTHLLNRFNPNRGLLALCLITGLSFQSAQAGVVISGTRQIYPEQNREISIRLTNDDRHHPRLVQAWIDSGDEKVSAEQSEAPFSLTPPVFRMDAGKSQVMRLTYTREPLPADKESLFWLNVLEIPANLPQQEVTDTQEETSQLRFAFRLRTKVFFRPKNLPGKPEDAATQLRWSVHRGKHGNFLQVHNPSAYHVTFNEVAMVMGQGPYAQLIVMGPVDMVAPGARLQFAFKDALNTVPPNAQVRFKYINDFGGFSAQHTALQP